MRPILRNVKIQNLSVSRISCRTKSVKINRSYSIVFNSQVSSTFTPTSRSDSVPTTNFILIHISQFPSLHTAPHYWFSVSNIFLSFYASMTIIRRGCWIYSSVLGASQASLMECVRNSAEIHSAVVKVEGISGKGAGVSSSHLILQMDFPSVPNELI